MGASNSCLLRVSTTHTACSSSKPADARDLQRHRLQTLIVGRIKKHQIERPRDTGSFRQPGRIRPHDPGPVRYFKILDIRLDNLEGRGGVVDQHRRRGPARQCLQAIGARPGEQVQNPGAIEVDPHTMSEDIEHRFPCPVGGRTHLPAGRHRDAPPPKTAADDPHRR